MLYAERFVSVNELKKWVKELSVATIDEVNIGGRNIKVDKNTWKILESQLKVFKICIDKLAEGDDWRKLQSDLSPLFNNAFFKVADNAIKIANYYECLVIASDIETKKKLIEGFDYQEIGSVQLFDGNKEIGCIGQKSDLIWSVLYDYFIFEDESGAVIHTIPNHEEYMSLQLWNIENYSMDEINHYVNLILLKCTLELSLNFKIVTLNKMVRDYGKAGMYVLQTQSHEFEYIPLMYLNNALHSFDARLGYLSYYQVLEYFFVRAQNYLLIEEIKNGKFLNSTKIDHKNFKLVLKNYVKILTERESLKLVLKKSVDVNKIKLWINEKEERKNQYTQGSNVNIDLSAEDDKIINKIAERIYYFRCAIAHAKGDVDEYIAIPEQSNQVISKELDLLKILAFDALKTWSNK